MRRPLPVSGQLDADIIHQAPALIIRTLFIWDLFVMCLLELKISREIYLVPSRLWWLCHHEPMQGRLIGKAAAQIPFSSTTEPQ